MATAWADIETVERASIADLDKWLLDRLDERWGPLQPQTWQSKFVAFERNNDYLFLKNETGIILAYVGARHAVLSRPVIIEGFAWSRKAAKDKTGRTDNWVMEKGSKGEADLLELYRHVRKWAESQKAVRMVLGFCSDLSPHVIRQQYRSDYVVDVIL